jgi:hypothetical protein
MKAYRERGTAPGIPNFDREWRCVRSFTHMPLYSRCGSPWYPSLRRLGGPHRVDLDFEEGVNPFSFSGF